MTLPYPRELYRDSHFIAVFKPAFWLVHRGLANDGIVMTDVMKRYLNVPTVYPVHRLDRQTSGVLLFALDSEAARRAAAMFESGKVQKQYLALVRGGCPDAGTIDHPVPRKEKGERIAAVSIYERLAIAETTPRHASLVRVWPQTGRFHQIRRHLKHINHPIIGDANYGKGDLNRAFRETYRLERMALHAERLTFAHPYSGQSVEIDAPLLSDLKEPFERMGFDY